MTFKLYLPLFIAETLYKRDIPTHILAINIIHVFVCFRLLFAEPDRKRKKRGLESEYRIEHQKLPYYWVFLFQIFFIEI